MIVVKRLLPPSSSFVFFGAGILLLYIFGNIAMAGNLEMVEESVRELDELNKKAVQQIPDLPATGTVDLKASVIYDDGMPTVDIYEKNITTEKNEEIQFDSGYTVETEKGESR